MRSRTLFGTDEEMLTPVTRWLRSPRRRYAIQVVQSARRRGIECTLTIEEYRELVGGASCWYCGGALPPTGSGLDRIDCAEGYSVGNVVPCCGPCNVERMAMPFEDYEAMWAARRARARGATQEEILAATDSLAPTAEATEAPASSPSRSVGS